MNNYSVILLNALPDKKIKSVGNRCLIPVKKTSNILDYHINSVKKIFNNPEIVLVGGFESKKVKKYLNDKHYNNIKYIEHEIDDLTNIGTSISLALNNVKYKNCLIINTNHILYKPAIAKIKTSLSSSFILYSVSKSDIGIIHDNGILLNCYYDLPNHMYDILYIHQNDYDTIKLNSCNISKFYLFEIINHYITLGLKINTIKTNSKDIGIINTNQNIERVKKILCST